MKGQLLKQCAFWFLASISLLSVTRADAQFTKGNLVILRVGSDTNATLTSKSTAAFLDQITTAGAPVNSLAIPVSGSCKADNEWHFYFRGADNTYG